MKVIRLLLSVTLLVMAIHATAQELAEDLDAKYATELLKPGTTAPEFTLPNPEGKKISMSQFKGQYVVMEFWASWCPDCRKLSPVVDSLITKYACKKMAFVNVSFDNNKQAWVEYITNKMTSRKANHVSDLKKMKDSPVAQAYHVKWIPSFYLIDPQGKVVLGTVEIDKIDKKLSELASQICGKDHKDGKCTCAKMK
ncbi:MAG: TlpA disulfide reductase family protein [Prevotella sp.]